MNPGGIRTDLIFSQLGRRGAGPGDLRRGLRRPAFRQQPDDDDAHRRPRSTRVLEQQWSGVGNAAAPKVLQVSSGFTYTWTHHARSADRVEPATIRIGGTAVTASGSYRVTVNSFLADGGFAILTQGTNRLGGAVDTDVLEAYFRANSPVPPGPAQSHHARQLVPHDPSVGNTKGLPLQAFRVNRPFFGDSREPGYTPWRSRPVGPRGVNRRGEEFCGEQPHAGCAGARNRDGGIRRRRDSERSVGRRDQPGLRGGRQRRRPTDA